VDLGEEDEPGLTDGKHRQPPRSYERASVTSADRSEPDRGGRAGATEIAGGTEIATATAAACSGNRRAAPRWRGYPPRAGGGGGGGGGASAVTGGETIAGAMSRDRRKFRRVPSRRCRRPTPRPSRKVNRCRRSGGEGRRRRASAASSASSRRARAPRPAGAVETKAALPAGGVAPMPPGRSVDAESHARGRRR